jgi:2-polyprenyl-3-methyl-5-hydroxy-6-metoxy-1,4-benzoquinol methylase
LQLVPPPSDLGRYYPPSYYDFPPDRAALLRASAPERYKLELVKRFVAGGRVLEIGPGVGGFLVVMQEAGYECSAIEMDRACCRYLRDVVGAETHESDDPAAVLSALGTFDVIALWHVLEHVPDPAGVLGAVAQALAPGGIAILATPNPNSLQFGLLRTRWAHLDAPRHLFLIPASEVIREAGVLGLEPVLETTQDDGTRGWNLFGWRESLAAAVRRPRAKGMLRMAGSVLMRVARPWEQREGRGSTYSLVLRKPE